MEKKPIAKTLRSLKEGQEVEFPKAQMLSVRTEIVRQQIMDEKNFTSKFDKEKGIIVVKRVA